MKAALETLAGLALIAVPSMAISFLTGQQLAEAGGLVLGRIGGAALVTLGIACWLVRNASQNRAALGLILALLFYDVSAVVIFLCAHFGMRLNGIGLWPAVALHSGLGVWSALCLKRVTPGGTLG